MSPGDTVISPNHSTLQHSCPGAATRKASTSSHPSLLWGQIQVNQEPPRAGQPSQPPPGDTRDTQRHTRDFNNALPRRLSGILAVMEGRVDYCL